VLCSSARSPLKNKGKLEIMTNQILLYTGAAMTLIWGVSHLFPTKSVVKGFGDITIDNKRIITMEWITEGFF